MFNLVKTAMLLAAMTALFMGAGYLIGGQQGMLIAFLIAAGMNFLLVELRVHGAENA